MGSESTSAQRGWADHPVYVAGISVAGTIAICIALYKEVLLPAHLATAEFKITELTRQSESNKTERLEAVSSAEKTKSSDAIEIKRLSSELTAVKEALGKVTQEFSNFKLGNLFSGGEVYPLLFEKVKIGQKIEIVDKVFQEGAIEKNDGHITVKVDHPFFDKIVFYYFDEAPHLIYQIMYSAPYDVERKVGPDYLQDQLERNFGEPLVVAEGKYIWNSRKKSIVYKDDNYSLIISGESTIPGGWERVMYKYWQSVSEKKELEKVPAIKR